VVSGYPDFSDAIVGSLQGPRWLTGGAYGIEASATASTVIAAAIVVLGVVVKQRPAPQLIVENALQLQITPDSSRGS